ncbi:MAG: DMT family transporter [Aestuariivirga sp.]
MTKTQLIARTILALLGFSGNSLLSRLALKTTTIDPASFISLRLGSAALMLALILAFTRSTRPTAGNWKSALALFVYAMWFSLSYVNIAAGTGALLLFGAVQITMIGVGLFHGERFNGFQLLGLALAVIGLFGLVLPGLSAPPIVSAALMIGAGVAWGVYSLLGRGAIDPIATTAGNFLRTLPMAALFSIVMLRSFHLDMWGVAYAVISGAITSGIGYCIWYSVLPSLKATQAATIQLVVPVLTALAAIALLGEELNLRIVLASIAILCGIGLVIYEKSRVATKA